MSAPTQTCSPAPAPGVVDRGDGQFAFTLFAPGKSRVSLIGDFNGWDPEADPLEQGDGGYWRRERRLGCGRYAYQYLVDGKRICDPYAREVVWADSGTVLPPQAILQTDAPAFEWRNDNWNRPPFRDLAIYELHVADFAVEGSFRAVTEKLDYLADLGINAIELMPLTEDALEEEWGYQPTYYFAANHEYGTARELKELIDAAHGRGIAVILDLVLAHTASIHPFNQMYAYDQSPWYGEGIGGPHVYGLPALDHRKEATQEFARQVQAYWLEEFHIDGIRYDYAINIGIDGDRGLPCLGKQARITRPDAYLIAEYLPEDPKVAGLCEFNASWHIRWSFAIRALARQGEFNGYNWHEFERTIRAIDPGAEGYAAADHMVNYIASHDEDRLVHELRDFGFDGEVSRQKVALAATILMTAPGVPMIYHGQEFGETAHRCINERNPLRWELLATRGGKSLFDHYRRLIRLRQQRPALRGEGFRIAAVHNDHKWVVFHRWEENGDQVTVAANFSGEARTITVPFSSQGSWQDVIYHQCVKVGESGTAALELRANGASVFVRT